MPASSSSLSVLTPVIGVGASPPVPLSATESIRLVQALKAVPDPRRRRGRRHGLQSVLLLAVQAVMAGAGGNRSADRRSARPPAHHMTTCGHGQARDGRTRAATWPYWAARRDQSMTNGAENRGLQGPETGFPDGPPVLLQRT